MGLSGVLVSLLGLGGFPTLVHWLISLYGWRVTYMLLGACDTDCDDVDLKILSPRGALLDSDTAADDFPMLTVTPAESGEYTVRVTMARCDTSICYYSLGVYGSQ